MLKIKFSENGQWSAMWSYVMAAARGDSRHRPGSIFTVHSASAVPSGGPCRDGLNSSFYGRGDRPVRQATYPPYFRDSFKDNDILHENQINKVNAIADEEAGTGAPAEVKIASPFQSPKHHQCDRETTTNHQWLMVVSLAVLYNVIFVIGRAVFWELNNAVPLLWWILDYICDSIYFLDILIRAHEGYLEQGLLVTNPRKLRKNYFSKKKWRSDFLSLIPTDLAYFWLSPYDCYAKVPCAVIVRLNRLLKLPRMWEWFERTETNTNYPNVFRICKVVLAILVLIHWNACLYFAISYAIGFGTDNWVYNINGTVNSTLTRQYIYSFYWSTLTLTTIGETPVPENDAEYLFVVANFLAGVLIFATIVGNIGSMISNMNLAKVDFQNRMDGVKQYMAFRKVGRDLESRVIRWFAYTWEESGALDEERVLSALPDKLKAEIAIKVHLDTLRKVRIFQGCEPGLLEALVLKLKLQVFSPKDYICRKGDVGKEMYIVKRGRLQVVADDGKTVLATLGAGSVFGEVSVLEIAGNRTGNRRTANVRSLGYSDLFCLAKEDLWQTLADYPEARASLMERGCQLLRKDGLLDEDVFKRAKQEQESVEQAMKRLESTVETLQTRVARLLAEFTASQAKLKQRLTRIEIRSHNKDDEAQDILSAPSTRRRLRSLDVRRRNSNFDDISRHKTM
ncbi:cyclic nucleotide-gated cation channel subunit A [Agrilus planipennis]|uniref:Cyclic nucleotide-gated cation channel subunit A n=1 Tax=Agrilus planipennis TaxID=224129 RepID=A0A7F5R353_AGRPL|nr:cyclic nucleotide-gated cation channel subunit A [Agrilus planipennis]